MPFTIAHAVVGPPLSRLSGGRLAVSALAVGAMSPDFEYLLVLETRRTISHTPLGLLVLCLPTSLFVLLLWHGVVKRPLAGLLPDRWAHLGAALCRPLPSTSWRFVAATVAAVLAGAWTHVVWDFFTHGDHAAVEALPVLGQRYLGRPLYEWLQHGCGLAGLVLLGVAAYRWAGRQPRVPVVQPPVRGRVAGAASIAGFTAAAALANIARTVVRFGVPSPRALVVAALLGSMAGAAVAVTAYGVSQTARGAAPT